MHNENIKNNAAANKRQNKLINWDTQVEKIEKYLKSITTQAKNESYFEDLYVSREENKRQIQLVTGVHPIGSIEIINDSQGRETGRRIKTEHGAGLVISQSIKGDVAIILYPYASEELRQADNYIIWDIFSDPKKITERVLKAAVNDFFTYARVSSALFNESVSDRWRIRYLSFRGKKYIGNGGLAKLLFSYWLKGIVATLGIIGSIASIYSVLPTKPIPQHDQVQISVQGEGLKHHCEKLSEGLAILAFAIEERDKAMRNGGQKFISTEVADKVIDGSNRLSTYLTQEEQTVLLTATKVYWGMANGTRSGWAIPRKDANSEKRNSENEYAKLAFEQDNQNFEDLKKHFSSLYFGKCELK